MIARASILVALSATLMAAERPVSYRHEVLPVLTRQGCNAGTCHGSPSGKGGFALSLFAFDAKADYAALTRDLMGRRVDVFDPELSLILRKPATDLAHRGGLKLPKDSQAWRLLHRWIVQNCPMDPTGTPSCTGITVDVPATILRWPKPETQIRVTARFADGTTSDITHLAQFITSDEIIATVSPGGKVTGRRRGQTAIMVRYLEHVEARAFTIVKSVAGFRWNNPPVANFVDRHVHAKLRELQFLPSGPSTDAEFVRRVHLDLLGHLPTTKETKAFLADNHDDKRSKLIDALLQHPGHALFFAQKWGDLLRVEPRQVAAPGAHKYHQWLVRAFASNLPYNQFVRALLTANGSTYTTPTANYYRTASTMNDTLETTAQLFMGSRLDCAKCHNHPFERWTQDHYYGLGAVFNRVRRQPGTRKDELFITHARTGEVTHPRTGRTMKPWLPGKGPIDVPAAADRREVFVNWLTRADNRWFARVEANRLWAQVMGRGIVEPIDDFRDSNAPSNAPLLEALASEFVKSGYDRRHLLRVILNSRTYQASSRPNEFNDEDNTLFSHYRPHLLTAEQLLDAVCQVTGVAETFPGLPPGTRATELPTPQLNNIFLKTFGQPPRASVCACERLSEPKLAQALELLNGKFLHGKLEAKNSRPKTLLAMGRTVNEIVAELYFAALSRPPTTEEHQLAEKHVTQAKDRAAALEDVLWSILNLNEFLFQH